MANNISLKQNLLTLKGATRMEIDGKNGKVKCLVIPIEMANLYDGEKGVYLDSTAIPLASQRENSKDTHLIKQSFGKDKFNAMNEEEKKAIPIMGNAIAWGETSSPAATTTNNTTNSKPDWL